MILTVYTAKGGTGKSTLAVNVGAAWANGVDVLLVDSDAQGTAGRMVSTEVGGPGLVDVLNGSATIQEATANTSVDGLFLLSGDGRIPDMQEAKLAGLSAMLQRFQGVVVIDCEPGRSPIASRALQIADAVVVPVVPRFADVMGMAEAVHALGDKVLGVVPQMVDRRVRVTDSLLGVLNENLGDLVTESIPISARCAECAAYGSPVVTYEPSNRAAVAYSELSRELMRRCRKRGIYGQ